MHILYIHTVFDAVRCLPPSTAAAMQAPSWTALEVQAHPVAGELVVHRNGFNRRIAKLLAKDGDTYLIPMLDEVRLLTINDRGVLLSGTRQGLQGLGFTPDLVVCNQPCARKRPIEPCRRQSHATGQSAASSERRHRQDDVRTFGQAGMR